MHLFIAPHPDDAPLSCGGTIYHLREAEGQTCVILTVMSGDPPNELPDTPLVRDLHQRWKAGENPMIVRREEDEQAALVLSVKSIIHTSVPDCVYRTAPDGTPLYPTEDSLWDVVHPQDSVPAALLATPLPYADQVTHVYAPLGVGHHVDHQILRDWVLALVERHPEVTFLLYEEFPYCEDAGAVEKALEFYSVALEPQPKLLREADVMIKLVALQNYTSQMSTFWGSIAEMDERVSNYMRRAGEMVGSQNPVERYWQIKL